MSSNDSNDESGIKVHTYRGGGRVSISHGGDEAHPDASQGDQPQEQPQRAQKPMRYNSRTGEVEHVTFGRVSVSGAADDSGASGILATARTVFGGPARELTPDTIVTHGGIEMTLRGAEQAGLVKRNEFGRYVEVTAQEHAQALPSEQEQSSGGTGNVNEMTEELFPPEYEAMLSQVAGDAKPEALMAVAMEQAFQFAETGALHINVERAVSLTGMEPEQAKAFFAMMQVGFTEQAAEVLTSRGIDPEAFVQWAREHRARQFKAAVVGQVRARTLAGYRELADDYLRNTTPDAESLNEAGYQTMKDPATGKLLVLVEGVWQSARAAARAGRI